jgi:hypothetical protein
MERKDVEAIINTFVEMVKETSKKSDEVLKLKQPNLDSETEKIFRLQLEIKIRSLPHYFSAKNYNKIG